MPYFPMSCRSKAVSRLPTYHYRAWSHRSKAEIDGLKPRVEVDGYVDRHVFDVVWAIASGSGG